MDRPLTKLEAVTFAAISLILALIINQIIPKDPLEVLDEETVTVIQNYQQCKNTSPKVVFDYYCVEHDKHFPERPHP
jgi:hypothetical protein